MNIYRFLATPAIMLLAGCASTSSYHNPKDPFEPLNRSVYKFNDAADKAVLKPVAKGYNAVVPLPGRSMVNNFFANLDDVVVTLNDVLQLKFVQALSDGGRVLINTTIGAGGLADAASKFGFEKHNEDFGQTLGYWGIGSGPYLVLPLLGPSSMRDSIGLYTDTTIAAPSSRIRPVRRRNQFAIVDGVRKRSNLLESEKLLEMAGMDPYSFMRDAYLSHRQSEVYDGNPPREKYDDDEEDDSPLPKSPETKPAPEKAAPDTTSGRSPASAVPAVTGAPGK